jgi:hypothetical protein
LETSPVQPRVLVHEPRTDQPAIAEPLWRGLLEKGRKSSLRILVIVPIYLAFMAWALYPAEPGVLIVLAVLTGLRWILALISLNRSSVLHRLGNMPFREVRPADGELLVSGVKVSFRLPGDGRWVVTKLSEAERLLLAGVRRVWTLGPDPSGRVFVALSGSVTGRMGRIRPEPVPGSTVLPNQDRQPAPPREDVVLRAALRRLQRRMVLGLVFFFALIGSLVWIFAADPFSDDSASASGLVGGVAGGTAVVAVFVFWVAVVTAGIARAVRAPNWTELWIVLDEGIRTTASTLAGTSGRTLLPDGREVTVKLQKVNVNLLANVRDTGRLWVLGTPEAGRPARIGLPGYPLLGTAKLGKR